MMATATAETPTFAADSGRDPDPSQWPVLVTGAGGFVGGHVARLLATSGHFVRGLARRPPNQYDGDPAIEWLVGDLQDSEIRRRALDGVRGVIHVASWVSLAPDRHGISHAVNVECTRQLLTEAAAAGVERFVYTSTIYSLAAGTADEPADESWAWNLQSIESDYLRTKRQAERLVLEANRPGFATIALCPGMVQGPRDLKPTSTSIAKTLSRTAIAIVPPGGIPIIDVELLALAHRRALICGDGGERYAVVGPYLSYGDLAGLVTRLTGRPWLLIQLPEWFKGLIVASAGLFGPVARTRWPDVSRPLASAGFLKLFVRGDRANTCFGLEHPPAIDSIARSL